MHEKGLLCNYMIITRLFPVVMLLEKIQIFHFCVEKRNKYLSMVFIVWNQHNHCVLGHLQFQHLSLVEPYLSSFYASLQSTELNLHLYVITYSNTHL